VATIDPTGRIYFERNGILVHIPSGMKFPARVGAFERDGLPLVHDRIGYNVGVGYTRRHGLFKQRRTTLSVFVYPWALQAEGGDGRMLADFRGVIGDVLRVQPGATLVSEGEETLTGAEGIVKGRRARFRIPQRSGISVSDLYLFRRGIWLVKHRITYPPSIGELQSSETMSILNALGYPRAE
jgi:hypothetical protein